MVYITMEVAGFAPTAIGIRNSLPLDLDTSKMVERVGFHTHTKGATLRLFLYLHRERESGRYLMDVKSTSRMEELGIAPRIPL
jgi:hypothetical protein